ncbi:MAG TPA: GNAT family N-acetyltransferase [Solirubrobacterales bacterium]|nr:GNAT family N-acetyltransferase [Solirubrobacterales bacterium]
MRCDTATIEQVQCRFRRDLWLVAPTDAVLEKGIEMENFGPILASTIAGFSEVPHLQLIQGAAEPGAVRDGHLDAAIGWMEEREVDYLIPVAADRPEAKRAEAWLNWHGYEQSTVTRNYARAAGWPRYPLPSDVEILELYPDEGEGMDEIAAAELGLPAVAGTILFHGLPNLEDWHCYVALLAGKLVACGSMLIFRDVAVLGIDGTLPQARGRGCNRALLCRRLQDAAKAGCRTVLAGGSEAATVGSSETVENLLSMGFVEIGRSVNWRTPGTIR